MRPDNPPSFYAREPEQYRVAIAMTPAEALAWIAREAASPEYVWDRLYEACKRHVPGFAASGWEMTAEVVEGVVVVTVWRVD